MSAKTISFGQKAFQKEYVHENVTYQYSLTYRKWAFKYGGNEYLCACHGGESHKVARIINGALKRSGALDGLGRANIERIIHPRFEIR